ncbi:hypothetical protein [Butyricimonas paravirosa]|uniref:hypothetical protein n=1 Tax=Butyricimonas paravirosa TaxID=1472417 RepID=UPI002A813CA6|nr:hypothetical protein [Butyricimonas paravirosa]
MNYILQKNYTCKMAKYYLVVLLSLILCCQVLNSKAQGIPLCLTVTDSLSTPLFGVYVVNERNRILVTSTNDDGQCWITSEDLVAGDTLEFSCLGFEVKRVPVQQLADGQVIVLRERRILLDDVYVGVQSPYEILEQISKDIKRKKKYKGYCYYGDGQYEKITECLGRAVEYRREYGCFFTVVNSRLENATFWGYGFVPRYTARSYPLRTDGCDTLTPLHERVGRVNECYTSGVRKIFWLMRAIERYGPLFDKMKYFTFEQIESENDDYIFQFKTKQAYYLKKTDLYCAGILVVDRETCRLKSMDFDYVEYYRCDAYNWEKKLIRKEIPVVSNAKLKFEYTSEGQYFVKSCILKSTWQKLMTDQKSYGSVPSRRDPGENKLVEKEAFYCKSYGKILDVQLGGSGAYTIGIATCNPQGEYRSEVFSRLPELLDSKQAFKDLSRYMDIHEQFKKMSNRAYYQDDYLLISPWLTDGYMKKHGEEKFLRRFMAKRYQVLSNFFKE